MNERSPVVLGLAEVGLRDEQVAPALGHLFVGVDEVRPLLSRPPLGLHVLRGQVSVCLGLDDPSLAVLGGEEVRVVGPAAVAELEVAEER